MAIRENTGTVLSLQQAVLSDGSHCDCYGDPAKPLQGYKQPLHTVLPKPGNDLTSLLRTKRIRNRSQNNLKVVIGMES